MILWTIQTEAAWCCARRRGVLRADGRRVWHSFRGPYRWLVREMVDRIGKPPRGVNYPIWAWAQYETAILRRPDLRHSGHLSPGTLGVLMQFAAPEDQTLLFDFDLWHYVLNGWYLPATLSVSHELARSAVASSARAREELATNF